MRIIAGEWRGRPLAAPSGRQTRPTSDRAREGLFSMLQSRLGSFDGLRVADLFAGTGALGLEALSRGAAHCLFIDNDPQAIAAIRRNVEALGAAKRVEIRAQQAEHAAPPRQPCDLVLLDPPYGSALGEAGLHHICNPAWVARSGLVSIETAGGELAVPDGFEVETERRFGKAQLKLLRRAD
jgi:16S rRNA (guanine966-N2)-methyltransferase